MPYVLTIIYFFFVKGRIFIYICYVFQLDAFPLRLFTECSIICAESEDCHPSCPPTCCKRDSAEKDDEKISVA